MIETTRLPFYKRFPSDEISDTRIVPMSLEEYGAYTRLMDYEWVNEGLPADCSKLAELCRVPESEMEELWESLRLHFEKQDGRLVHPGLEQQRRKIREKKQKQSEAGKKGAAVRWGSEQDDEDTSHEAGSPPHQSNSEGTARGSDDGDPIAGPRRGHGDPIASSDPDADPERKVDAEANPDSSGSDEPERALGGMKLLTNTDAAAEFLEPLTRDWPDDWRSVVAPLTRSLLWLGDDPPDLGEDREWSMGRELHCWKQELKGGGYGFRHAVGLLVKGARLRERGGLPGVEPGTPITIRRLLFHPEWEARAVYSRAEELWQRELNELARKAADGASGSELVRAILQGDPGSDRRNGDSGNR